MKLAGKYIWITGSSGGIGLAMAQQALAEGAAHIVLSGRNREKLDAASERCRQRAKEMNTQTQIASICFDIGKSEEIHRAVEELWQQLPRLDILVHNAGISQRAPMLSTSLEVEQKLMQVNYWGAVELTKLLLPKMLKMPSHDLCYIGVTSSVTGLFGVPLRTTYCASKHALNGYFMALESEYYRQGLRVTLICPGKINTEISKSALRGDGSSLGVVERGHEEGLSAAACAKIFWRAVKRGRLICYAVRFERVAIWLHRISPQWGAALIRKILPLPEESEERSDAAW